MIPAAVGGGQDGADVPGAQGVVEKALVQHHAHVLLGLPLLQDVVMAHEGNGPSIPSDQIEDALDGGGLARPVLPDETHDGPAGEGQGYVAEGKVAVRLAQP